MYMVLSLAYPLEVAEFLPVIQVVDSTLCIMLCIHIWTVLTGHPWLFSRFSFLCLCLN